MGSFRFSFIALRCLVALVCAWTLTFPSVPALGSLDGPIRVLLHSIEAQPIQDQLAYQIQVGVSVLNEQGLSVKGLKADNFLLLEDSRAVQSDVSVELMPPKSFHYVLALDTSGSMFGKGLAGAQKASELFLDQLGPEDSIAIIKFDEQVKLLSDFTSDRSKVKDVLAGMSVTGNLGTCLYDALYDAVQKTASQPQGERLVLALTDGKDELPNLSKPCSSKNIEDVLQLATEEIVTPIYIIGIGKKIDPNILKRISEMTGGAFLEDEDIAQAEKLFEKLGDQLHNLYGISYTSTNTPGTHILTVQVNMDSAGEMSAQKGEATRKFFLEELPPVIVITSPIDGQTIKGRTSIQVNLEGRSDFVRAVEFDLNGIVEKDTSPPFGSAIDPAKFKPGRMLLTVRAYDAKDNQLSDTSIQVIIPAPVIAGPQALATPTTLPATASPTPPPVTNPTASGWLYPLVGASLLILGVGLGFFVWLSRKSRKDRSNLSTPASGLVKTANPPSQEGCLGMLTIRFSDDPVRLNEQIPINKSPVSLGRSAENDLIFPRDHPVSRKHAIIECKNGRFTLAEVLSPSSDGMKRPTFGTYVNNVKLLEEPRSLKTGDVIRLGNRLELVFESRLTPPEADATTDDVAGNTLKRPGGALEVTLKE